MHALMAAMWHFDKVKVVKLLWHKTLHNFRSRQEIVILRCYSRQMLCTTFINRQWRRDWRSRREKIVGATLHIDTSRRVNNFVVRQVQCATLEMMVDKKVGDSVVWQMLSTTLEIDKRQKAKMLKQIHFLFYFTFYLHMNRDKQIRKVKNVESRI